MTETVDSLASKHLHPLPYMAQPIPEAQQAEAAINDTAAFPIPPVPPSVIRYSTIDRGDEWPSENRHDAAGSRSASPDLLAGDDGGFDDSLLPYWARPNTRGNSSTPGAVQDRRSHAGQKPEPAPWDSWYKPRKPDSQATSGTTSNSRDGDTMVQHAVRAGEDTQDLSLNETQGFSAYREDFEGVGNSAADDVTSLDAYRERVRQYAKTYGVPMDEGKILKEALRQRKRDMKTGVLQKMKNSWFQLEGGKEDPRIVHERDEPYWTNAYVKAVGDAALVGAVKKTEPIKPMSPEEQFVYDEGTDPRYAGTEMMKRHMHMQYRVWGEGVRRQERADRRQIREDRQEARRAVVRRNVAAVAINAYLTMPELLQDAVNNVVDKRSTGKRKNKAAVA